jgi:tetratricopeptide (TPR) repeat protein
MSVEQAEISYKIKTAREFEAQGKLLHAIQVYNSIIEDYPDAADAYFNLALIYENINKLDMGVHLLRELLENNPNNREVRLFLGQLLLKNHMWDEAVEILSFIMPDEEPVVSFFLGYANFMMEEYEAAKINLLNFIDFGNQSELMHEAQLYLGKTEIKLNNYQNALEYLKKAQAIYDNYWELNLLNAQAYFYLGMYTHAVKYAEKAVSLNQNDPAVHEWAGKIYIRIGDYFRAEKSLLRHIELRKDLTSEAYATLADVCLKAKKPKAALDYFELALKIDPDNQAALNGKKNADRILQNNSGSNA